MKTINICLESYVELQKNKVTYLSISIARDIQAVMCKGLNPIEIRVESFFVKKVKGKKKIVSYKLVAIN